MKCLEVRTIYKETEKPSVETLILTIYCKIYKSITCNSEKSGINHNRAPSHYHRHIVLSITRTRTNQPFCTIQGVCVPNLWLVIVVDDGVVLFKIKRYY